MKSNVTGAILFLLAALWSPDAMSADDIGAAVRIVNRVTAEDNQVAHPLAQGDGVRQNETIDVAAESLGELRLNDDTKVALGPGAKLKLDKFVYDPDKSNSEITVDLAKGAFRFITGLAKKPSYLIRAPNASITVRGTVFDVYVDANGTLWVLLHEGSIDVCNSAKQCKAVKAACGMIRVGPGGVLSEPGTWNKQPDISEIAFEVAFPFVVNPPEFDPAPRFTRASVETGTCVADTLRPPTLQRAEVPRSTPQSSPPRPVQQASVSTPAQPAPSAPVVPVFSTWTGPYAGITYGTGWGPGDTPTPCSDPTAVVDTTAPNCRLSYASGGLERSYELSPNGWLGGTVTGYNFQAGNIVAGMETDLSAGSIAGSDTGSGNLFNGSPGQRYLSQELDWFGTVRGRLGVVTGNLMVYTTAGLAYGRSTVRYDAAYTTDNAFADASSSSWSAGWTAGAGAELAFGAWSLKGEYLYYDLGNEKLRAQLVFSGVPAPVYFEPEFENNGHIVRIGLNYHFK